MGTEGVRLTSEINDVKTTIEKEIQNLKEIENKITPNIIGIYNIGEFLLLQKDSSIDQKITDKEKEIRIVKAYQEIRVKESLKEISLIDLGIDLNTLRGMLQKSISSISKSYLEKVEVHKNELTMKGEEEVWLQKGYENIKNNNCPFCLQSLDNAKDIIEAYQQYFNKEYNELKKDVAGFNNRIQSINIETIFSSRELNIEKNERLNEFWKNYITFKFIGEPIFNDREKIIQCLEGIKSVIAIKNRNPLNVPDTSKISEIKELINKTNELIRKYNEQVKSLNAEIQKLKSKSQADVGTLEQGTKKLKLQKRRFEKELYDLCSAYTSKQDELRELNKIKDKKQEKLNSYTEDIFDKYGNKINEYLKKFGVDFELHEAKSQYKGAGKDPFAEYVLKISGCEIKFDDDGSSPCIKNVLSEGDKSALAFSFFLAKLDLDATISNKIIIFDDPISSFDNNRKTATIQQLTRLNSVAKQVIVLTHNLLFARSFWDALVDKENCQTLHIYRTKQSNILGKWDLEKETSGEYFQNYRVLERYLNEGVAGQDELRKVAQCIRPLLEGYLRTKFPDKFCAKWLGDICGEIRDCQEGDVMFPMKAKLSEIEEINSFSKKYHHSTNPNTDNETIIDNELKNYVNRTLDFIHTI
ncbi:MAG: AAA family ATPase [Nitrospirota bacterium]